MESVRLTCATKPNVGEKWLLERRRKGLLLLDGDEKVVTSIPAGEAGLRILFPSFWASRAKLVITGDRGKLLLFEPGKKTVAKIRGLVEDCIEADPEAAAAAYTSKAIRDLLIGGGSVVLGLIVTAASFIFAAPDGKFYVMTGLLGVGLVEIIRGIYFSIKASRLSQLAESDEEEDEENDDE
jgi:hypothetical protein